MPPKKPAQPKTKNTRSTASSKPKVAYKEGMVLALLDSSSGSGFRLAIATADIEENPKKNPILIPLEKNGKQEMVFVANENQMEFAFEEILGEATTSEVKVKKGKKSVTGHSIEPSEEKRLKLLAGNNESRESSESSESESEEEKETPASERVIARVRREKPKDTEMGNKPKSRPSNTLATKRSKPSRSASASKFDVVKSKRSTKQLQNPDGEAVSMKEEEEGMDSDQSEDKYKGKYKKGKFNPAAKVVTSLSQLHGKDKKPQFSPNIRNNNKEVLRAVVNGNKALLKEILKSKSKISTVCQTWAPENQRHPVLEAIKNNDLEMLNLLVQHIQKVDKDYGVINECALKEIDTGFNDFYAYGVRTRKVAMSRGGKEGNNAFVADLREANDNIGVILPRIMIEGASPEMIDHLRASVPSLEYQMENHIGEAIRAGNYILAGHLISYANKRGGFGFNQQHEFALTKKTKEELGAFKKVSATKKSQNNFAITPVHCACINPEPAVLKALLEVCMEFGVMDLELRKPVHYAAACESSGPLEFLIEKNADTRETDKMKVSPLMLACQFGRAHNVRILVQAERSIVAGRSREGMAAVHYAAKYGKTECLEILLQNGVDVNVPGPGRQTPLHLAAAHGFPETVKFLLSKGASVLKKDKHGRSALIMAIRNGDIHSATLLMRAGSPVDAHDSSKNYPLHYACAYGFNELIDSIVQAGADLNPNNSWNLSPLLVAMLKGNYDTVKKMLAYPKTDVNCKDDEGRTLVSSATNNISEFGLEQIKFLVEEKKADVNIPDLKGLTPLHYVCQLKAKQLCQKHIFNFDKLRLSEQKEDILGYERLIEKFVEVLVRNGADLNVVSEDGQTPLSIVLAKRNHSLISLLLENPNIDLFLTTKLGTNIFHDLHTLVMKKNFLSFFRAIHDKVGSKRGEMLNQVDDQGFTPVLKIAQAFGRTAKTTWTSLSNKIKTRRLERKINEISHGTTGDRMIVESGSSGLRMGARIKMAAMKRPAFMKTQIVDVPDGKSQKVTLTEEELQQCSDLLEQEFAQRIEEFLEILRVFRESKADLSRRVEKKKEFRDKPDETDIGMRIAPEETQEDQSQANNIFNSRTKTIRRLGGFYPAKIPQFQDPNEKKKVIPYGPEGQQSILHLVMKSPYLQVVQSILAIPEVSINEQDYYGRTPCLLYAQNISDFDSWAFPSLQFLMTKGASPNIPDNKGDYPVLVCLRKQSYKIMDFLFSAGLDLNVMDKKGNTPLHYCVNKNQLTVTEKLLENGADPNFKDKNGRNSLHWAVHTASQTTDSSFEMIDLLFNAGGNINAIDNRGRSPLHYSFVKMGSPFETSHTDPIEIVSSLCGLQGINLEISDKWGNTPLLYAAQRGSNVSANFLLIRGANIEATNEDNNTPIGVAIVCGHDNMATSLIQAKANVQKTCNKVDPKEKLKRQNEGEEEKEEKSEDDDPQPSRPMKFGLPAQKLFTFGSKKMRPGMEEEATSSNCEFGEYSLFRFALKRNWQGVAYLILEGGYSIMLAIQDAMSEGKLQYVYTLLQKRNAIEYQRVNDKNQSLWHTFGRDCAKVSQELFEKICRQLVQKLISPNSKDNEDRTPMHYAAQSSFILLISRMIEMGLSLNDRDKHGDTPFSLYLKNKKSAPGLAELKKLLQNGARLDQTFIRENYGEVTPLIYLIMEGCRDLNVISEFLENGSSVNEQDDKGLTPVMHAVRQNSKKLLKVFLAQKDLDPKMTDKEGKTPIHHCVNPIEFGSYENIEILRILVKYFDVNAEDKEGHSAAFYANFQDSEVMKKELLKLGASDVPMGMLRRAPTSVISTVSFLEPVAFEEDSDAFLEKMKEKEMSEFIPTEEREKPDEQVSGTVEVVYHPTLGPYSIVMIKVDIAHGFWSGNVFYRMQLLHEKNRGIFIVFTRWGRVGEIGQFQQTPFPTEEEAAKEFSKIFKEKSGNEWANKDSFVKVPKKYKLVKLEKRVNAKNYLKPFELENKALPRTELPKSIFCVVDSITDVKMYETSFLNFGIDQELMPLSSLSKASLIEAKGVLDEIGILLERLEKKRKQLKEAASIASVILEISEEVSEKSSRFYELVPHSQFKAASVPPISNTYILGQKKEMIQNLLDFEVTTKIIIGAFYRLRETHPLDYCYRALHIRMLPLERENPEHSVILKYIRNGWSNFNEKLIKNIFALERPGEAERIAKFKQLDNRMLLWHGTKLANVLSILHSGLKIAPPEAPVTGYMFGKGIYFADMFEKSYNYCSGNFGYLGHLNRADPKSMKFMFLCEVALGKMKELKQAEFITKLPSSFNSVKGVGRRGPNFKKSVVLSNGARVPLGELIDYPLDKDEENHWGSLSHNEYIVYDVSQVRIRYMIQLADDPENEF